MSPTRKAAPGSRTRPARPVPAPRAEKRSGKGKPKRPPSTASTPPTDPTNLAIVEGVEGQPQKPIYDWYADQPLDHNFRCVGTGMSRLVPTLYRHLDDGLLLVEGTRIHRIRTAKQLSPLLIDNINIRVWKEEGKRAERLGQGVLTDMLNSRSFLGVFPMVQDIITSPIVLPDGTPSRPGLNEGGYLYLGPPVQVANGQATLSRFLDQVEFDSSASRTNAVAAALTVFFPHRWYGGKPVVIVTSNKSHSGKSTLCKFIAGNCPQAYILYQKQDWPMEQSLQRQLTERPEIGVICFDNVRLGSSGGGREIRSGLFESFITSSELVLSAAKLSSTFRRQNKYVVLLNTNEGVMSADLLNRSLPIGLNSTGDIEERLAKAKANLGGDLKTEWLPENMPAIEAELWGMIDKWHQEGKPLEKNVKYPMAPWAQTIGGILAVNGFMDFLGNYRTTRAAVDPIREAIGYLAFYAVQETKKRGLKALPTIDLGKLVTEKALDKVLLPGVDSSNRAACEREIGRRLTPYDGETFTASTANEVITYKLQKKADRWNGSTVSFRYHFEEIKRGPAANHTGVVLEEQQLPLSRESAIFDPNLDQFQPRTELPQ